MSQSREQPLEHSIENHTRCSIFFLELGSLRVHPAGMQSYLDRNGDSGVAAYEIKDDGIVVQFKTGATYLYNYSSAGTAIIETMKQLAKAGDGLNSYINTNAKKKYARKLL